MWGLNLLLSKIWGYSKPIYLNFPIFHIQMVNKSIATPCQFQPLVFTLSSDLNLSTKPYRHNYLIFREMLPFFVPKAHCPSHIIAHTLDFHCSFLCLCLLSFFKFQKGKEPHIPYLLLYPQHLAQSLLHHDHTVFTV